ncbi:MFS transporter [Pseudonocardia cypriaca]|uniref:Putative MFS family arabinose efflux permease n=1 Tax=Pseudonocardia cypriaca TaxID=882449 RepID=A0A543FR12_9PSEU|nr:MFS transporter [Pseudonocardia cypriaca]TQM36231.1 putative MFS family arabinose efflux permease [Pseudonocardia cypriaca]
MAARALNLLLPSICKNPLVRDTAFLRLWTGITASGLATWALPFLLALAVLDGSLDATGLGLALAARTAGFLAAVPAAGVLADRYPRRTVVAWSAAAAAVASPVAAAGLGTSTLVLAVAAAVVGAGQGACRPAFQALTAEVVAPERRQQANAAMTIAVRVSVLVAPSVAALLALAVDVHTLVAGTGALWLVAALLPPRGAVAAPPTRSPFLREFADGLAEARRHPWFLAGLAALTAVIATGYSATGVALPLIARDRYGTEAVLAAATTGYALGALAGAFLVVRWRPAAPGRVALGGLACYALAPLALLLPVPAAVLVAAYVVTGIGIELFNVPWFTATQREVDPRLLARVSSVDFLFSYGLAPLGLALIAPAITVFGAGPVLLACALVCLAAPAAAMLVPGTRAFSRRL